MPNKEDTTTNILPHNPMKANNIFEHVKQLKGEMKWYEFDLRCIHAMYPEDETVANALHAIEQAASDKAEATNKAKVVEQEKAAAKPTPAPEPEKPAAKATDTKGKKTATTGKPKKQRKTLAEVQAANTATEKGSSLMPKEDDVAELADIK